MSDTATKSRDSKSQIQDGPKKFPDAYDPFLPVLERLSEPLKAILRGHLGSLESIFHTIQRRDPNLIGDFEGVGGLTQRGDMSRILQSELLLRTEAPLEFLRRIAENEALYMETEHSDPGEKLIYRLIISVGPNMLGHGRIVALACLIFLARVAHTQKTELHWCVLPNKNGVHWFQEVSVNSVKRFLKYGSYADAVPEDIQKATAVWSQVFAQDWPRDTIFQDWYVGAQSHGPSPAPAMRSNLDEITNTLTLTLDPPQNGPRNAFLDLKRKGTSLRRLNLTFPEDVVCVSALNRPLRPIAKVKTGEPESVALPQLLGWEPRYIMSPGPDRHIVRFEAFPRGLLFLDTQYGDLFRKPYFLPLPSEMQLAGIHFGSDKSTITILAQKTSGKSEAIIYNSLRIDTKHIGDPQVKEITSAHLFSKQPGHAIPILHPYKGARCYTSLGQPFEFSVSHKQPPKINILYKEKRILFADGTYKVLQFDPQGKSPSDQQETGGGFTSPSLHVMRKMRRKVAAYPVETGLTHDRLRAVAYSRSSRGLTYSVFPGQWRVLERRPGSDPNDFSDMTIILAPYEIILRTHITHEGVCAIIYSDATRGGDGVLRSAIYNEEQFIRHDTLYKFKKNADTLTGLRMLGDGRVLGLTLDTQGEPQTLIILNKTNGVYKKQVLHLEDALKRAQEIDPVKVFG